MRETNLKYWKYSGELADLVVLENQTGAVNIMLLPGGNGIKPESVSPIINHEIAHGQ
jgi:hypothetical protein